jgi:hypothetical protein
MRDARVSPLLLLGLAAAAGLWALSRTTKGAAVAQSVVGTVASAATSAGAWVMSQVRGIRNNNPGNIVRGTDVWEGESADQSADAHFVVFTAPEWGIRAMARILRGYFNEGLVSVAQVIGKWAPSSENDTSSYTQAVAAALGVDPNATLDLEASLPDLIAAIIHQENGIQPYPPDLIAQGIALEASA